MEMWEIDILTRKRWIYLVICCMINLCIGSMYAWSVLAGPMAEELNVTNLSTPFSVANSVGFISMIIGGLAADKKGPRWVIFLGGLMFGLGMFGCGYAQKVGHLILCYGIILGLGLSFVYGCTISICIKFFPDKRGLAGGMATAFYGISSAIFAPVGNVLNQAVGVRGAFKLLGAVFLVVVCIGALFISACPDGFVPTGYVKPLQLRGGNAKDRTTSEMLRMPVFYVMLLILTCGGTFGMMVISNAAGLAKDIVGVNEGTAAMLVLLLCLFNTAGRLLAGALSDKLGRINTLTGAIAVALLGMSFLYAADATASLTALVAGLILTGICFGTFMGVFPGFCTDQFGSKHNTVNYGIMWIGFCVAGIVGPTILTKTYASTGTYRSAFLIAAAIAVLGMIMTFIYRLIIRSHCGNSNADNIQEPICEKPYCTEGTRIFDNRNLD